jgi:hypothetical protein
MLHVLQSSQSCDPQSSATCNTQVHSPDKRTRISINSNVPHMCYLDTNMIICYTRSICKANERVLEVRS